MSTASNGSGFQRAPVCKFLLGSMFGSSFLLNFPLKHHKDYFIYTHTDVFDKYQVWRCITSKLAYLDIKDLFICSMLLYYFRVFERRLGSQKFCTYLLGTSTISVLLELGVVYLCRQLDISLGPLPSGPLPLIYPLFVVYYCDIPRVPLSHIWGIPMTGKSLSYILGLHVASTSPESIIMAVCGIVAGILWRVNFLKLRSVIRVPDVLARICGSTVGRLLEGTSIIEQNTSHMGATLEIQRQETMERLEQQVIWRSLQQGQNNRGPLNIGRPQPQNLANGVGIFGAGNNNFADDLRQRFNEGVEPEPVQEVSEDQVQLLVEMGFNQDQVRHALQVHNNDISMATNFLLQQT